MMKKTGRNKSKSLVWAVSALLSLILCFSGCASRATGTETEAKTEKQTLPSLTNDSEAPILWEAKFVTADEVALMFQKYYSELGHAGRNQRVAEEIEGIIQRIHQCNDEIIASLYGRAERVIDYFKKKDSKVSYEYYVETIIRPYEDYYNERMSLGETFSDLYLDFAAIRALGGNSSGDVALTHEYAYFQNFLCELMELREFVELKDYMK